MLFAVIDRGGETAASNRYGRIMEPGIVAADLVAQGKEAHTCALSEVDDVAKGVRSISVDLFGCTGTFLLTWKVGSGEHTEDSALCLQHISTYTGIYRCGMCGGG